ncbi:MAG TPA: hypothetical protein ENK36_07480 [Desulfobacterales bacterium]|nr:hypothetical protein [Desulfobacterales bacterium]
MDIYNKKLEAALKRYNLSIKEPTLQTFFKEILSSENILPDFEQQALMLKLISNWKLRKDEKIIAEIVDIKTGDSGNSLVTIFGVLSVDWPGLFDACTGVIHEVGWNISFVKGLSLPGQHENIGIVLIGIAISDKETLDKIKKDKNLIISKINQAAVGTKAKTYLLSEEFRKLEIYSQVIGHIEKIYKKDDIDKIIGLNGEAVKYFAARSRDYIENRKIEDIARQIILNYEFVSSIDKTGDTIKLDITNFQTKAEGTFTGITVAGPSHLLHLEDCLKTIEYTIPNFSLKHNREFTTTHGVSVFRIEFVDSTGNALSELEQSRLKQAFSKLVLTKKRDRAQWIESIGGFEQYARAIIPLLVREAEQSKTTQVYQSVSQATDIFIDFKIIVVIPSNQSLGQGVISKTVNKLEEVPSFHIHSVKPPKKFGNTRVFIIDMRVHLTAIENTETIYETIREKLQQSIGNFRDFDAGMRTLDSAKLRAIREKLKGVNKNIIRELYYSIEDFYRISASGDEIADHIKIILEMLDIINQDPRLILRIIHKTGTISPSGDFIPSATLLCIAYKHQFNLLKYIIDILEPYETTLSRLEKSGRDILICRLTKNDKPLSEHDERVLIKKIDKLEKEITKKNST